MEDFLPIAQAAGAILAVIMPIVWRLASRLQKMESSLTGQSDEVACKIVAVEEDVAEVKEGQKTGAETERNGRKELWKELSEIRERLVKIETKLNGGAA